jgi:nucleoside 2-deoxyribosyltransferase
MICLVGHVLVDVSFPSAESPLIKMRAGGILHAARALWAIDCAYSIAFCAPEYLDGEVQKNATQYGAASAIKIGNVLGSPNVILIGDMKEAGPQGYEYLLRDEKRCILDTDSLRRAVNGVDDILLFYGDFDLRSMLPILGDAKAGVHFDANFEPHTADDFNALGRPFDTIILSSSSDVFRGQYRGESIRACEALLDKHCHVFLLKENRGGSRAFRKGGLTFQVPAQPRNIHHSVGLGDCFDAIFVALRKSMSAAAALAYASCIAAEYACTTYPEIFKERAQAWLGVPEAEITALAGVELNWEARRALNVYVAAPDFDHVDRAPIERAAEALRYHNFTPRLPVQENGQMGEGADVARREALCNADLKILDDCKLMLAVHVYDDPGTLIEIGMAVARGIPVVVYDPLKRVVGNANANLMLTQLPYLVSSSLDEVITAIFELAAGIVTNERN